MESQIEDNRMNINDFIQDKLAELHLERVSAVDANKWTDEACLLKDDNKDPGRPIRVKCRNNEIDGAVLENKRWFIYRVRRALSFNNSTTPDIKKQAHQEIDYIEALSQYEPHFNGILNKTTLYNIMRNDPASILVKTRIAGENITRLIAIEKCSDQYHDQMTLHEVINLLLENEVISTMAKGIIDALRVYGNSALSSPTDIYGHEKAMTSMACKALRLYLDTLKNDGLI